MPGSKPYADRNTGLIPYKYFFFSSRLVTLGWMDGWMISFTLTPRHTSDMQATTTICILVVLITVIITFLTGDRSTVLYAFLH